MLARPKLIPGFTLAEVLIALALLGAIAAFTIPKIMVSQNNARFNSIAKETMATISEAYVLLKQSKNYEIPTTTIGADLFPFMNTLGPVSVSIDSVPVDSTIYDCSSAEYVCHRLSNGSVLLAHSASGIPLYSFGGTSTGHAINFLLDPDGRQTNKQDSIAIWIFYNGKVTTASHLPPTGALRSSGAPQFPYNDPAWFQW